MLRTLYDTDVTTWSPQGKLFQVDYAMEAVKQGSVCMGLRSQHHAVLCSLKRSPLELANFFEKVFKVDDHVGMAMSGLTADGRILCKYMRSECLNYKFTYGSNHPVGRLISKVGDKSQVKTQNASKRPYGVGLLVAGMDQDGPHIFETCPSGNYYEYFCYAIGARSQAAKTYFENYLEKIKKAPSAENLALHALSALKKCSQEGDDINEKSVEMAIISTDGYKLSS
ncbi:uncharacterized protein LOC127594885 [Hippocampus zosterae]|uniref:uncharacterized protein LOC127594885 n=1 Tax=Hippocampus zosterae TaxID=109293 RepID=UPI00223DD48D|nr:uncharacterized protein LOC127594885 [Hippocampus zosterae]